MHMSGCGSEAYTLLAKRGPGVKHDEEVADSQDDDDIVLGVPSFVLVCSGAVGVLAVAQEVGHLMLPPSSLDGGRRKPSSTCSICGGIGRLAATTAIR